MPEYQPFRVHQIFIKVSIRPADKLIVRRKLRDGRASSERQFDLENNIMANNNEQPAKVSTTDSSVYVRPEKGAKGQSIAGLYLRQGPKGYFLSSTTIKEDTVLKAGSQITIDLSKILVTE